MPEKGENQSINQAFIFTQLTKGSYDVDGEAKTIGALNIVAELATLAISETKHNGLGPVHINIRLSEPLYNESGESPEDLDFNAEEYKRASKSNGKALQGFSQHLLDAGKKLIIVGMRYPNRVFSQNLQLLSQRKDTVVLLKPCPMPFLTRLSVITMLVWN